MRASAVPSHQATLGARNGPRGFGGAIDGWASTSNARLITEGRAGALEGLSRVATAVSFLPSILKQSLSARVVVGRIPTSRIVSGFKLGNGLRRARGEDNANQGQQ